MTVVFDFDKTLTDTDTTLPFFLFCGKNKIKGKIFIIIVYFFLKILSKLHVISVRKEKEIGLLLFCPKNINEFKKQCALFSKQIKLNDIYYNEYLKLKSPDNKLIVASASFQYYLDFLFPESVVFGTTLRVNSIGKILGIKTHPFREEKSKVLLENHINKIDLFYTDSINDASTVKLAQKTRWVKNGKIVN